MVAGDPRCLSIVVGTGQGKNMKQISLNSEAGALRRDVQAEA